VIKSVTVDGVWRVTKKLWLDSTKWKHDRFDPRSQAPKSHDEIIATYGFDIRTVQNSNSLSSGTARTGRKTRYIPLFKCTTLVLSCCWTICYIMLNTDWDLAVLKKIFVIIQARFLNNPSKCPYIQSCCSKTCTVYLGCMFQLLFFNLSIFCIWVEVLVQVIRLHM